MNYIDKLFNLSGKVAVITGGGGVLAATIGKGLANAGMKIVFLDINEEAAKKAASLIINDGGVALGLKTDVLDMAALEQTKDLIIQKYGTVDLSRKIHYLVVKMGAKCYI